MSGSRLTSVQVRVLSLAAKDVPGKTRTSYIVFDLSKGLGTLMPAQSQDFGRAQGVQLAPGDIVELSADGYEPLLAFVKVTR
jgi:hypothetical protein